MQVPESIRSAVEQYAKVQAGCLRSYKILAERGKWFFNDGTISEPRGEVKACFRNVWQMLPQSNMHPVYGFALGERFPFPLMHAWLVDNDGRVIERTPSWNTPTYYFGLHVPKDLALAVCAINSPACQDVLFAYQWFKNKAAFETSLLDANLAGGLSNGD